MIPLQPFRQLLAVTTALSLALPAAFAQEDNTAPPARVGQITAISGSVSFNGSGSGGWAAAADNYPVTAGDSLYTQQDSRAGIALDASQITLAGDTELEVTELNDDSFAATLSEGEAAFAVNYLQPGQAFTISTPRGAVTIRQNGQYDIEAGDADTPTIVNVYQGEAAVSDPGVNLQVTAGQAGILTGADQITAQLGQAQQDAFAGAALAQTAPPPSYAPPLVNQMTGVAELSQYGAWEQSPQYGAIWYPTVGAGWAPYRQGHWAFIQPWGWTWVESEPWGFAPFHYGRWVDAGGRWGWAPAPAYAGSPADQPVYAPAVVGFFGLGVAGITAAALASGSVGWVPLAPDEPYYPTYHCPPAYIRRINVVNVRDINTLHVTNNYYYGSNFSPDQLANRRAATFVPAGVMRNGEHVAGYAQLPPNRLAEARPIETGGPGPQAASFRLPEAAMPMAEQRPGAAPPADFANRHAMPAGARPSFETAPGYHAPPPPGAAENQSIYHPQENAPFPRATEPHPAAPELPPPTRAYHPPAETYRPPVDPYHPPAQTYHPAAEAYHPPAPEYHPQEPQFHPQQAAQPRPMEMLQPHAEPGHGEPGHGEPGHGDEHHNQ